MPLCVSPEDIKCLSDRFLEERLFPNGLSLQSGTEQSVWSARKMCKRLLLPLGRAQAKLRVPRPLASGDVEDEVAEEEEDELREEPPPGEEGKMCTALTSGLCRRPVGRENEGTKCPTSCQRRRPAGRAARAGGEEPLSSAT